MPLATVRIVHCAVDDAVAYARIVRPDAPTLRVDTTDGYHPSLDEIVSFVNG